MEQLSREDLERLMFFEQAREQAENDFRANNRDAQALTRWGGALLELAHFRQGDDSYGMIETAVEKFKQGIAIDSNRHDTKWCLGNAYTSQGFLTSDSDKAQEFFTLATGCFGEALQQDPGNEVYRKALDMTKKAPELHAELQRQLAAQGETISLGSGGGGGGSKTAAKSVVSDFWYDIAGWGLLVAIGFGIVALSKNAPQPGGVPVK
jgi:tetratricopeptide (TPR) repeat protein